MRQVVRFGAGLGLALVLVTCTDRSVTGPRHPGSAALDLRALASPAPGTPPVPIDSLEIIFRRADESIALDKRIGFRSDTLTSDSGVVRLDLELSQNSETFSVFVRAFGGGVDWYSFSGSVAVMAGATARPALTGQYVGPGANAARVTLFPADTTVVGGTSFALRAVAFDPAGAPIAGVPIGYRLSDTTRGRVTYPTPYSATLTAALSLRDSAWLVAEIPTHLRDSTRVHLVPQPAQLVRVGGDGQTGVLSAPLKSALVVRVLDALGGGFKGDSVHWAVTAGAATLSAAGGGSVTDDTGYAQVTVTPTLLGTLKVQATAQPIGGGSIAQSPASFAALVGAGNVKQVVISPKIDTVAYGAAPAQFTATLYDSLGNIVTATVLWSSTVPGVATVDASGLATAVGGDSTRIIASASGYADTARLYVRALRTITLGPADTVITAVGDSLQLRTVALDNFGAPVTSGLNIKFTSASPGVVTVDAQGKAKIVGPGNGVVLAKDSVAPAIVAQGSATLRVNQVAFAIATSPRVDTIGVGGQGQILAAARDSNGYAIPGKTFTWVARADSLGRTILAVTGSGIVSATQLGSAYVVASLVEGAKTLLDSSRVVVSTAPPKLLQWGFDSTAVGNGGSVSIGLAVTSPPTAPLTVTIGSSDSTVAKANPNTVVIGAGSSATSVTVYGVKAGRAVLTAADASGQGYASRQMTVGVVSTITFREIASPCCQQQYFYLNQNETHKAQVWLSDPAPLGGLGITFVYGKGLVAVSPSPAVILAGQLSADIVMQGLQPGASGQPDSVVPTSGGYIGKFSYVYVAPDSLRLTLPFPYTGTLGVGQSFQPYASFQYAMDHPLVVATRLSSPQLGTTSSSVTIPTGQTLGSLTVSATAPGSDTLAVSAPGWVGTSALLTFTTPRLGAGGTTSLVAGNPQNGSWSVSTLDSLGYGHAVTDTLVVTAVSRNPNAVAVDVAAAKVLPGQGSAGGNNALRALPGAGGDSAWIVLTASGYRPDSFKVYVTKPTLALNLGYPYDGRVAVGTRAQSGGYVTIPYARPDTFTVVFAHSHRGLVSGPDSLSIPKGQTIAYFDLIGDSLGVDTVTVARATGYVVQGSPQVWTVDPIHVRAYNYPGTLYTISRPQVVTALVVDSADGYARPLVAPLLVAFTSTNPRTLTLDSAQVPIDSGQVTSHLDTLRVVTGGDTTAGAFVRITAPGSTPDSTPLIKVLPTPLTISLGFPGTGYVGNGLRLPNNYVSIPDIAPDTVRIALHRFDPLRDSLSVDSAKILKGNTISLPFDVLGLASSGSDSITASAVGFVTARQTVHDTTPALTSDRLGTSHFTTDNPKSVFVYTRTPQGYQQSPIVPVTFSIKSTDSTVLRIDSAGVVVRADTATSTVAAGQTYGYYRVRYAGSGTAKIYVSAPGFLGDSTELVSVTGPALHLAYTTVTTGVGQVFTAEYVSLDNPVSGTPLVVSLQRSDSANASQIFGLDSTAVTIPVGSGTSGVFGIAGLNAGSAQVIARAAGYSQATANVTVGLPRLAVGSKTLGLLVGAPPTPVTVFTEDQTGATRIVATAITVGVSSSQPAVATPDSGALPIAARAYYNSVGVQGIQKGSAAIVFSTLGYKSDTVQVSVDTAALSLTSPPSGLGPNQVAQMQVSLPFSATAPVVVSLASSNPGVATVPASVTIPVGSSFASFSITGTGSGTAVITATASGFRPAAPVTLATGTPLLSLGVPGSVIVGVPSAIYVYTLDSLGQNRNVSAPLTVTLTSTSPAHAAFGSTTMTIPAGGSSASTTVTVDSAGSYTVSASAPGYTGTSGSTVAIGALVTMVAPTKFSTGTIAITAGQYVTWKNLDTVVHTSTSDASGWDSGDVQPGGTFTQYFAVPGTYAYHCRYHQSVGMTGTVIVQ